MFITAGISNNNTWRVNRSARSEYFDFIVSIYSIDSSIITVIVNENEI